VDDVFGYGTNIFAVTVTDVNDPPVLAPIPDQSTPANTVLTVPLVVSDAETAITALHYSATVSNPSLLQPVTFDVTATGVTAIVTPVKDASGVSSVAVTVHDGQASVTQTFAVTVQAPPNKPPVLAPIPDQTGFEGVAKVVPLSVTDPDTAIAELVFTGKASNTNLVRSVLFGLAGESDVVATINLRSGVTGTSAIEITVSDGPNQTSRSFILTVVERPNEPPTLASIPDQTTVANVPVTVPLTVSDPDTAIEKLVFTGTSSNPSLVSAVTFQVNGSAVSATVGLVKDATGIAVVTISVNDGKTTVSQTFALQVNVPPPPVLTPAVKTNPDGSKTITITWTDGGELQYSDSPAGPWTGTGNTSGTFTETISQGFRFYRVWRENL